MYNIKKLFNVHPTNTIIWAPSERMKIQYLPKLKQTQGKTTGAFSGNDRPGLLPTIVHFTAGITAAG